MQSLYAPPRFGDYAHAGLILLAFALFASETLVHYPVALMSLLGLAGMVRSPGHLTERPTRRLVLLFALVWLPMLAAFPDAVNPDRSAKTVLLYLHFLPAAYYLLWVCVRPHVLRMVTAGVVMLVLFTTLDAFAQLVWGSNFFGYPYDGNILKGVFDPKQRLGLFLAVFAPLCLQMLRQWSVRYPPLWLVLIPYVVVMLMSLKRSAWLMLAVGVTAYLVTARQPGHADSGRGKRAWQVALVVLVIAVTVAFSPVLRKHVTRTAGVFSGDSATFDHATSYRLTLWQTGIDMFADNWLNGVGPRGYRRAYREYAARDDFWIARGTGGQTHPHMILLEVAVEAGVIGLLGLLIFQAVLWTLVIASGGARAPPVWLLCAAVAWFPLNAHLAFYGSYWSTLAWMLIGIGLAAGAAADGRQSRDTR